MSRNMEFAAFQVALLLLPLTARAALCSNYRDASTCEGRNDGGCSCIWDVSAGLGSASGDEKSDGKCVKSERCDGFGITGVGTTGSESSVLTCRDVKGLYRATGCCGNPSKNIMLPARNRRLDSERDAADTQDLLASIEDTFQQLQQKGDHLEAKGFAARVENILKSYI
eukprot:TRINITY_DN4939_c0_g1_i1.p1 TRINITY_DN4939_c0_g1~~TRINITY_DN4939_c0_g1_i1.p1  ORF type:complete len:183 (+),score=41.75 TRINITY_DN4939_c0_g1_i1:45-551(+)